MNRYYSPLFSGGTRDLKDTINLSGYSTKVQNYLTEIIGTTEVILGVNSIKAVVLFGSLVYDKISDVSDVDVLIITHQSIPKPLFNKLDRILTAIEIKYSYFLVESGYISRILQYIERSTGMFRSHFICSYKDWKSEKFHKIFNTSRIVTKILAPTQIVFNSVISNSVVIYGELEVIPAAKRTFFVPLFQSLVMTTLMSSGTLVACVFNIKFMKYALEAIKWALRTGSTQIFQKSLPLEKIIRFYGRRGISPHFLRKFLYYRENPSFDITFLLRAPAIIIRIHIQTLMLSLSMPK